ncbi:MAG: anti-sigma factor antagonist [Acidobacteriota bacterium]
MHAKMETVGDTLMVRVGGDLDMAITDELRSVIDERLKREKPRNLIWDMSDVSFIDSSGLGVIIGRYKKVMGQGGRSYIVKARPPVAKLLEVSGISKLIPIHTNEKEILSAEKRRIRES